MAGELRVKNLIIEDLQNTSFTGVDANGRFKGVNGTTISSFTFQKGSLLNQTGSPTIQGNNLQLTSGSNFEISTVEDSVTSVTVNSINTSNGDLRVSQYNGSTEISAIYMVLVGPTLNFALIDPLVGNVGTGSFLVSFPFTFKFYQSFDSVKFLPEGYPGTQGNIPTSTVDRIRLSSTTGNTDIKLLTVQTKAF